MSISSKDRGKNTNFAKESRKNANFDKESRKKRRKFLIKFLSLPRRGKKKRKNSNSIIKSQILSKGYRKKS